MKKLLDFIEKDNIADDLSVERLAKVCDVVLQNFNDDWESMAHYREITDAGIKLAEPEVKSRSTPWQGAANYKTTDMISACVGFGDRASLELLDKNKDLFLMDVVGQDDEQKTRKARATRIQKYENFQLMYGMPDWIEEQRKLLYTLPAYGTVFKKVFFDPVDGVKKACSINYPNFVVNQATKNLQTCRAFTEVHRFSYNDAQTYIRMGWWSTINLDRDEQAQTKPEPDDGFVGDDVYLEQHCYLDLDADGYDEPYVVTVHKASSQVCRIVAAYDKSGIVFRNGGVISNLQKADNLGALDEVLRTGKLIKINRLMLITKYGFIKSVNGDFLDVGYYYLLSPKAQLINTTTNQLLDGGTLANLPAGMLSREHRQKKGESNFKPGEFRQTDIPAIALQNSVMKLPVSEPSQSLMVLNETTKKELQDFAASLDMEGLLGSHVSATSALVVAQEALIPHSAIMNGILLSQSDEFEKLYRLTPDYLEDGEYSRIIGEQASVRQDYSDPLIIQATSKKVMNNVVVQMYQSEALMAMIPTILQSGGNVVPIIQQHIKQIGSIDVDAIYRPMSEEEQRAKSQEMMAAQQREAELQALNIQIAQGQVDAFKHEQKAAQMKQENERAKLMSDIDLKKAQTDKTDAEAEGQRIENTIMPAKAVAELRKED